MSLCTSSLDPYEFFVQLGRAFSHLGDRSSQSKVWQLFHSVTRDAKAVEAYPQLVNRDITRITDPRIAETAKYLYSIIASLAPGEKPRANFIEALAFNADCLHVVRDLQQQLQQADELPDQYVNHLETSLSQLFDRWFCFLLEEPEEFGKILINPSVYALASSFFQQHWEEIAREGLVHTLVGWCGAQYQEIEKKVKVLLASPLLSEDEKIMIRSQVEGMRSACAFSTNFSWPMLLHAMRMITTLRTQIVEKIRENILKALKQVFADHADGIHQALLHLWPEIGKDLKVSGATRKIEGQEGHAYYTLKYRYRGGVPQVVVKQRLGHGAHKTIEKILVLSGRELTEVSTPVAYAKARTRSEIEIQDMLREAEFSSRIHKHLTSMDQSNVVHIVEVKYLRKPSEIKALQLDLCEGDASSVTHNVEAYSPKDRLMLARCAANGLAHMHQRGLCHLDFKPTNFLIRRETSGLRGYVADLGLSDEVGVVTSGGTKVYMPPSILDRTQLIASPDIDAWSLGLCIVELLLGQSANPFPWLSQEDFRPPFTKWQAAYAQLIQDVQFMKPPLNTLLLGLLDLDPSRRTSASEACTILDQVLRQPW